jgi:phosphatidylserine/phosphatidylglycerophosphate/cardiolipin synthase-like enzyme
MSVILFLMFAASIVFLIMGFISPKSSLFWLKKKSRKASAVIYGFSTLILLILFCVSLPPTTQTASTPKPLTSSAKVINSSKIEAVSSKLSPKSTQTSSQQSQTQQSNSLSVQYYFPRGGQNPEPVLIGLINSAKSSLDIAIYSFTDTKVSDAVISAKKRGVAVRVISDKECSSDSYQKKVLNELKSDGIPVKINTHSGLMHLKVSIIDNRIATTGSYNYTTAVMYENDEVFVVLNDAKTAQDFDAQFVRMWNDTNDFTNY